MKFKKGLSLVEILISIAILATIVVVLFGVIGYSFTAIRKGKNMEIASNMAIAQLEVYKNNFHMMPFYPGISVGSYYYPDRANPGDNNQVGKFINHNSDEKNLPSGNYYGGKHNGIHPTDYDFYHSTPYDLNRDSFMNDIIEPLAPKTIDGTTFIPVLEIKPWTNGFNINNIKQLSVTVYWQESLNGITTSQKQVTFNGYIIRTCGDPY